MSVILRGLGGYALVTFGLADSRYILNPGGTAVWRSSGRRTIGQPGYVLYTNRSA